jgi:hypothetical protein
MTSPALSVREVSELLKMRQHAVLALIRSDQLRAVDVSLRQGGRPRWRILAEDLDAFLLRRTHQAPMPRRQRPRRAATVKQYF